MPVKVRHTVPAPRSIIEVIRKTLEGFHGSGPANGHYTIAPGGHLLVWADGEPGQNFTNRADLHVNFKPRDAGKAIGLFAAGGAQIDAVTFGQQTNNVSQSRAPDGGTNIVLFSMPTPRAANSAGPPPPAQLTSIGVAGANVTLTFATQPGRHYRVQFKNDLSAPAWNDLPGDVIAGGTVSTKMDTTSGT